MSEGRRIRPIAGGRGEVGQATVVPGVAPVTRPAVVRSSPLENERVLGWVLLTPTIILLGLFIAYPFVKGVWLSMTSTTVGVPGDFVWFKNFIKIWNDSIFQRAAYNTFVYT